MIIGISLFVAFLVFICIGAMRALSRREIEDAKRHETSFTVRIDCESAVYESGEKSVKTIPANPQTQIIRDGQKPCGNPACAMQLPQSANYCRLCGYAFESGVTMATTTDGKMTQMCAMDYRGEAATWALQHQAELEAMLRERYAQATDRVQEVAQ